MSQEVWSICNNSRGLLTRYGLRVMKHPCVGGAEGNYKHSNVIKHRRFIRNGFFCLNPETTYRMFRSYEGSFEDLPDKKARTSLILEKIEYFRRLAGIYHAYSVGRAQISRESISLIEYTCPETWDRVLEVISVFKGKNRSKPYMFTVCTTVNAPVLQGFNALGYESSFESLVCKLLGDIYVCLNLEKMKDFEVYSVSPHNIFHEKGAVEDLYLKAVMRMDL